jgi:hypothetical protein
MLDLVRRADFTNSLVHLTRERKELNKKTLKFEIVASPFDVLKEILAAGVIRGGTGFVKGSQAVVCLSEIPLASMNEFSGPVGSNARYRSYGVAFSKKAVFNAGGRPVIYIPDDEGQWIPADQKWRQVKFDPHRSIGRTSENGAYRVTSISQKCRAST